MLLMLEVYLIGSDVVRISLLSYSIVVCFWSVYKEKHTIMVAGTMLTSQRHCCHRHFYKKNIMLEVEQC